jgi:hypothetical protein
MGLFEGYVRERQPSPATIKRCRTIISNLIDHFRHSDANAPRGWPLIALDKFEARSSGYKSWSQRAQSALCQFPMRCKQFAPTITA